MENNNKSKKTGMNNQSRMSLNLNCYHYRMKYMMIINILYMINIQIAE